MKKYILIESETHTVTPFRHFSDLINTVASKSFTSTVTPTKNKVRTIPHNRWNVDLYIEQEDDDLILKSFNAKDKPAYKIQFDLLIDTIRKGSVHCWAGVGFLARDFDRTKLIYYYRDKDLVLKHCGTDTPISKDDEVLMDTVFLIHGSWPGPLYHVILNDDVVFTTGCYVDNDDYFIDYNTFHLQTVKDYVMFPSIKRAFESDNIIISPGNNFTIDFFGRSRLKNDTDFNYDTMPLKVKSNIRFEKIGTGKYEFFIQNGETGFIYARIPADFGAEQDPRTRLRCAYTVHKY